MPRKLNNWSYQSVTDFIKEHGFVFFDELKGSRVWTKLQDGEPDRFVELSVRSEKYSARTMKGIIRQSGIIEKHWIEGAGSYPRNRTSLPAPNRERKKELSKKNNRVGFDALT